MKKIMIAGLAAAAALSPLSVTTASAAPRGEYDRSDHRAERRDDRRDDRREVRRDHGRHNGYWYNGRFYRGEPSYAQRRGRDFRYDYRAWRRGERLNAYERAHYRRVADYRAYRLSAPPRGYEWRRTDTGDYVLAAIATGVILSVILGAAN